MVYKKMPEKEWVEIGNQAERFRKNLFRLMGMSYGKMPQLTVAPLKGTLKHLDKFKLQAEGRMFQIGDSQKENIFFGNKTKLNVEVEENNKTRGIKTSYKKMSEHEWVKIGNQAKLVEEEISKLKNMTTGKMPVKIVDSLIKSSDELGRFKSRAEDRMIKMGDSESLNVFYGDKIKPETFKENTEKRENIMTFKEWIEEFKNVNRPIGDLAKDIKEDPDFPNTSNYDECLKHLQKKTRVNAVFETFESAWEYYKQDTLED